MRIGLIGGTGREGKGLATRWARAGHQICIGSRDPDKARARAAELRDAGAVEGGDNAWAAGQAEVALLSVPYAAHASTLAEVRAPLEGKILIDITVPLKPPKVTEVQLPPGHSAALEARALLAPSTRVVAALHHVSSALLADPARTIDCDVLVCGDDEPARAAVIALVTDLGLRGLDAGALANSVALESITPILLHLNKRYKSPGSGIRFTGV
jgi:NADPH-dependent F420 reductase